MPNRITAAPRAAVRQPRAPAASTPAPARTSTGWVPRTPAAAPAVYATPLERIAKARLVNGAASTCVTTVRKNLRRLGFEGLPESTSGDRNNPRGMMVQMLNSGHWKMAEVPGAERKTIQSGYGTVEAHVLSREAWEAAVDAGQIPEGAVVFQTKHGWDYGKGSKGNDVGLVQKGAIHNFKRMSGMNVYGDKTREVVVLLPR